VLGDRQQSRTKALLKTALAESGGIPALAGRCALLIGQHGQDGSHARQLEGILRRVPVMGLLSGSVGLSKVVEIILEAVKDRETVLLLKQFLQDLSPPLMDALITSRDDFMFAKMRQELLAAQDGQTAVAVVGLAHLSGLEDRWTAVYGEASLSHISGL